MERQIRPKRTSMALAIAFALANCVAGEILLAQQTKPGSPMRLPVIVDGSKTPDQIPDELAYQHYLKAISAHPDPLPQERDRQAAQLNALNLSSSDRRALIAVLASLRTQLDLIENTRRSIRPGPAGAAQLSDLNIQENTLLTTALGNLRASMTLDGSYRLDQFVKTHVKARIKIYGTAP